MRFSLTLLLMSLSFPTGVNPSGPVRFRAHVIEAEIPSGYTVLVADINNGLVNMAAHDSDGDGRLDIVLIGGATANIKWYENLGSEGR